MRQDKILAIVTGKKEEGKSTFIKQIMDVFHAADISLCGLYSPGIYEKNLKIGINVIDIATGDCLQLANYDPGWDSEMPLREWRFNDEAIEWGDKVLLRSLKHNYDVLIVDEVGYLELEKQQGWKSVYSILREGNFLKTYLVVRENLLGLAQETWQYAQIISISNVKNIENWMSNEVDEIMALKGRRTSQSQTPR